MSSKPYLHDHPEFKELIRIVADRPMSSDGGKIDPYLVEKDYWIMHCLYGLRAAGYDFQLKGGTSLSKGYGLIHRFSEDIDIHIAPPPSLTVKTSRNHDKEADRQSRKDYYDYLAREISIPGIKAVQRDAAFDSLPKYFSGGIRLLYDAKFPSDGTAKEGILLEVGFDDVIPNQPIDISSWALDFALEKKVDVINNKAVAIPCYDPGYTLVEKLQAVVTKFRKHQEEGGKIPPNFMRHYYDIYCLLQDEKVLSFIGTDAYLQHKKRRFPDADLTQPLSESEALLLPNKNIRDLYRKEYEGKAALYYQGQPSFEDILGLIREYSKKL